MFIFHISRYIYWLRSTAAPKGGFQFCHRMQVFGLDNNSEAGGKGLEKCEYTRRKVYHIFPSLMSTLPYLRLRRSARITMCKLTIMSHTHTICHFSNHSVKGSALSIIEVADKWLRYRCASASVIGSDRY